MVSTLAENSKCFYWYEIELGVNLITECRLAITQINKSKKKKKNPFSTSATYINCFYVTNGMK